MGGQAGAESVGRRALRARPQDFGQSAGARIGHVIQLVARPDVLRPQLGLRAEQDTRLLLISGEPLDETIAGSGELVLNTPEQVEQSLQDLAAGQFGTL